MRTNIRTTTTTTTTALALAAAALIAACGGATHGTGNPTAPPAAKDPFGVPSHATPTGAAIGFLDALAADGDKPERPDLLSWVHDADGSNTGRLLSDLPVHYRLDVQSFKIEPQNDYPDEVLADFRIDLCDTGTGRCTLWQPAQGVDDDGRDFYTVKVDGQWYLELADDGKGLDNALGSLEAAEGKYG